jgi:hypothetical protein
MADEEKDDAVQDRLRRLYPSCETDCTDGCRYGCLGWLHRFGPSPSSGTEEPARKSLETKEEREG